MWKKIKNFFMDWVWQLPQNLLGFGYKLAIYEDISDNLTNTDEHYTIYLKDTNGGVTLGKYIFVYRRFNNLAYVVKHECGHVKQSKMLGPLYLIVIGVPSILHAWLNDYIGCCATHEDGYYHFYTEHILMGEFDVRNK